MATKKTNKPKNTAIKWALGLVGAVGLTYFVWNKLNGVKALGEGIRAQVGEIDFAKLLSTNPKLPVRVDIDNNSDQAITLNNIIATLYKVDDAGKLSQLAANTPTGNINVPAQKRTSVNLNITIPALSIISTIGSGLFNKGKENYVLEASVVVLNKTQKLDPVKFSV